MTSEADEKVLKGILGRTLADWKLCDDGMHFTLDDGTILIFAGMFSIAVFRPTKDIIH